MQIAELLERIITDVRLSLSLATLLPLGSAKPSDNGEVARASWALPVAGLVVGLAGAIAYWAARKVGLPSDPAAVLALAATVLVTGALHEDGLADAADGLGGGKSREQKLAIMRDSRIGSYGACALILSMIVRWSALATIAEPRAVTSALLVAHVAARASLPALMWLVPPARSDGLSAGAGQPLGESALIAAGLGFLALVFGFGFARAMLGLCLLALCVALWSFLATRAVGGQTGDILGALEQTSEIAILLLATTAVHTGI
jgi:adenosylcobinamide-GDP ribazoletransferase